MRSFDDSGSTSITRAKEAFSGLDPTADTRARLQALLELGLPIDELADTIGVSPTTLRNWTDREVPPRRKVLRKVDDLRHTAYILLVEGDFERSAAAQWLLSRQKSETLNNERPLDVLPEDPVRVMAAAEEAIGRDETDAEPGHFGPLEIVPDPAAHN